MEKVRRGGGACYSCHRHEPIYRALARQVAFRAWRTQQARPGLRDAASHKVRKTQNSFGRRVGLMAGYGVQLWPILQDIHQLRALYGKRAETFLANASVLQVFGVNDHETARLVSNLLGQETVVFRTASTSTSESSSSGSSFSSGYSASESSAENRTARALMTPDEVRTMDPNAQLLFLAGMHPIAARKIRYFEDSEFLAEVNEPSGEATRMQLRNGGTS